MSSQFNREYPIQIPPKNDHVGTTSSEHLVWEAVGLLPVRGYVKYLCINNLTVKVLGQSLD